MEVAGKILEFEYENGERYRLLFGIKTVTWACLSGSSAESFKTDYYSAIEIAPKSYLFPGRRMMAKSRTL